MPTWDLSGEDVAHRDGLQLSIHGKCQLTFGFSPLETTRIMICLQFFESDSVEFQSVKILKNQRNQLLQKIPLENH